MVVLLILDVHVGRLAASALIGHTLFVKPLVMAERLEVPLYLQEQLLIGHSTCLLPGGVQGGRRSGVNQMANNLVACNVLSACTNHYVAGLDPRRRRISQRPRSSPLLPLALCSRPKSSPPFICTTRWFASRPTAK